MIDRTGIEIVDTLVNTHASAVLEKKAADIWQKNVNTLTPAIRSRVNDILTHDPGDRGKYTLFSTLYDPIGNAGGRGARLQHSNGIELKLVGNTEKDWMAMELSARSTVEDKSLEQVVFRIYSGNIENSARQTVTPIEINGLEEILTLFDGQSVGSYQSNEFILEDSKV